MHLNLDAIQLRGRQRAKALAFANRQCDQWGLAMPACEPLVMDFGRDDYEHLGLIEYWIANQTEEGYCGKYMFVLGGQRCPIHSHLEKHETFFIVKGKVGLTANGAEHVLNQGDSFALGPGLVHGFRGIGNALILEVSSPCYIKDNKFEDPEIAGWAEKNCS